MQEQRTDIDVVLTGLSKSESGESGKVVWHDIQGIIVDKNGKKIRDLGQTSSRVKFVKNGNKCVLDSYSLPLAG
ncbi:MAG: hypothetical protein ACJ75J_18655 [Cytophagaceae bacterium]